MIGRQLRSFAGRTPLGSFERAAGSAPCTAVAARLICFPPSLHGAKADAGSGDAARSLAAGFCAASTVDFAPPEIAMLLALYYEHRRFEERLPRDHRSIIRCEHVAALGHQVAHGLRNAQRT